MRPPPPDERRCTASTAKGTRCTAARKVQEYCRQHARRLGLEEGPRAGRRGSFGEVTTQRLENAFAGLMTDGEACAFAFISTTTFYRWLAEGEEVGPNGEPADEKKWAFRERIHTAREGSKLGLALSAVGHAQTDGRLALRILAIRDPANWAHRSQLEVNTGASGIQVYLPAEDSDGSETTTEERETNDGK